MANPVEELTDRKQQDTAKTEKHRPGGDLLHRIALVSLFTIVALLVAGTVLLIVEWPFTRDKIAQHLGEATGTKVQMRSFRAMHFPYPGCVMEGVVFQLPVPNAPPLITMTRLTMRGSYFDLFTRHVAIMTAEGMHVTIPPFGTNWAKHRGKSNAIIHKFVTAGAVLDFARHGVGQQPLRFDIRDFELHELGGDVPMVFQSSLHIPEPPGDVQISGRLGPWSANSASNTPLSGSYSLSNARLDALSGVKGTLSSQGKFQGTLKKLDLQGDTNTPDFGADGSENRLPLQTHFVATVDATAGDIVLTSVSARLRNTEILGQGTIQSQPGSKGKTEDINFTVKDGRVEDVLALFVKKEPPISGAISFKAHTRVPSEQGRFLKKVQLQGDFDIRQGLLMNTRTQHSVDTLSADARGAKDKKRAEEDPQRVFSSLGGHVDLKTGVADFKNLVFEVPGATAHMGGKFNVINEGVNLNGTLQLQAKLSNATSGIKSFLVKILDPFIKKNHSQAPLPVSITGTYDHPHYQVLLTKK